jgi:glyoxylase-like metal-dependent hydrolase (beta-lactamase superfamily II)
MIETTQYEEITQIRMSRELNRQAVYWVSAYLVDGLLIDTGCSHTSVELTSFLEGKAIGRVINTHYHEDHIGGNHDIMTRFGVDALAHPDSIPLIATRPELFPYQEIAWGYPTPTKVKPVPDVINTPRHQFQMIETPGHCNGHICLFEPDKGWCFTGDLFARENPKFIRPEENVGQLIDSMQKIMDLPSNRLVLFTSVGKIVEDGREALRQCVTYMKDLTRRIMERHSSGLSIDDIVKAEFGGEHPFSDLTNGQFSSYQLVRSTLETVG